MDSSASKIESEPERAEDSAQDDGDKQNDDEKKLWRGKKPWKKQNVYKSLAQQIEFYFSSSNLSKDRFMSKLIQDDPCKLLSIHSAIKY